jgi:arabinoxylan arabinofuranohydrolase
MGLLSLCLAGLFLGAAHADNPIVQTIYSADPAPVVIDDRVYLYTSHDEDGSKDFTMRNWHVFSSADMVNWQAHGSPLGLQSFSWAKNNAWAGQLIPRNGKYYWYVPISPRQGGYMAIGVAVCETPIGPCKDALGKPLIDNGEFDPSVFIDDDGQAYLYWGNPKLWYAKLNNDMISLKGGAVGVNLNTQGFGPRSGSASNKKAVSYEEGPWIYKRGSIYYLVYAANCCDEDIRYSTSSSPTGPWTYKGLVMASGGGSFTNHPGLVEFKNGSYFFYHNGQLPGGSGYTRSVAVEKFTYGADGSIPTIKQTKEGAPQVGTLDPYQKVEAETMAASSGVKADTCSEGGMALTSINNGDWVKVKGVAFGDGAKAFTARVAAAGAGGKIELRVGASAAAGTLVGACAVAGTGGLQSWASVNCTVDGATGTKDLFLRFTGGSGELFRFNWWQFSA